MTLNADTVPLYAETLVRQVQAGGALLDYTPASLSLLDSLLADVESPFAALEEGPRQVAVFYLGCYLGEVLVRSRAGQWQFSPTWFDSTLLVASASGGVQVRPFEKILRRLTEGEEGNSLSAYYEGLSEYLRL